MSLKVWESKDLLSSTDLNANFAAILAMNVYNEDLTAYTNGIDVTFTPANYYKPGTLRVYLSAGPTGSLYRLKLKTGTGPADGDYLEILELGEGKSFQLVGAPPITLSKLVVDYQKASV